ncbi:MAG: hypothetical protein ABJA94_06710 [Rhodoglobus sp.]
MVYVLNGIAVLFVAFLFFYPSWSKWERERNRVNGTRRTVTSGMVSGIDELFHPNAHQAQLVWEAQQEMPVPAPDSDKNRPDLDAGRVTIDLC